jgi:hypothetical protein
MTRIDEILLATRPLYTRDRPDSAAAVSVTGQVFGQARPHFGILLAHFMSMRLALKSSHELNFFWAKSLSQAIQILDTHGDKLSLSHALTNQKKSKRTLI